MWLSEKIKRQEDIKGALRDLAKKINQYEDATILEENEAFSKKFFSAELGRWLRPRWWVFVLLTLGSGILGVSVCWILDTEVLKGWAMMNIMIIVPVFVLGVSLSTVARNISVSGRFAAEYLHDSCRITMTASLSLLAVLFSILAVIFTDSLWLWVKSGVVTASLGAVIWSVTSLAYIIVEVARFSVTKYSTFAASTYASRKLCCAFLKDAYLSIWMAKYGELLDAYCEKRKAIRKPGEYMSLLYGSSFGGNKEVKEQQIKLPYDIDFHLGCRDFNFGRLEEIDRFLEKESAVLYLAPHGMEGNCLGRVSAEEEKLEKVVNSIEQKINRTCKFHEDRFKEEKADFWESHLGTMRITLKKTIKEHDIEAFKTFLEYSQKPVLLLGQEKNKKEIDNVELGWKKSRVLRLHKDCLEEVLNIREEDAETRNKMVEEVIYYSIGKHVQEAIRNSAIDTIRIITWIVTALYKKIVNKVKRSDALWKSRAQSGSFYAYINKYIEISGKGLPQEKIERLRLAFHEGITRWLLIVIESKDDELVKSLCEASRNLVFPDGVIAFEPEELVIRHFVLCGKMIEFLLEKKIAAEAVKTMFFEKHENFPNIDFDRLAEFYGKNRFPREKIGDYVREFFYDWSSKNVDPLTSIGGGHAQFISGGESELGNAFVYLALLALQINREPKIIPVDFRLENLNEKADALCEREIARGLGIHSTKHTCEIFKKWLQKCKESREKEEEKRIAESPLLPECVELYEKGFWEGYKERLSFLEFCVENGHVNVDETAERKLFDRAPKRILLDKDLGTFNFGKQQGGELGRFAQNDIIKKITDTDNGHENIVDDIALMVKNAEEWLSNRGCTEKDGLLVVRGNKTPETWLLGDELYRPRWREEKDCRFNGFYKNFPLIYIHEKGKVPQCMAIDLKGWRGLCARTEFLTQKKFGEIEIKTRTDEEINKAIEKGDVKEEQRDQVKGNCPIEVTLFWKWDEKKKPAIQTIALESKEEPNG